MIPLETVKIGVLMGGRSSEREISIQSGRAIEASLRRQGLSSVIIDVDKDVAGNIRQEKIGLAFIALHGRWGEDGTIQGLLEIMGVPYTGSGVLASAIGMNKAMTKRLLEYFKVKTPSFSVLYQGVNKGALPKGLSLPVVFKPSSHGSTLGVSIVEKADQISKAFEEAFQYDQEVLVEEYVAGHEVTAGILGEETLPLIEIISKEPFFNYDAKYTKGLTEMIVPAPLSGPITHRIQELALGLHRALGCRGYSRVDFRVDPQGEPYVLEINTLPGMTETSLLPKAAGAIGLDYDALVRRIITSALGEKESA